MGKLKQAYISNRDAQIGALLAGNEILFSFYGARLERAINALVKQAGSEEDAAIIVIEWETEL